MFGRRRKERRGGSRRIIREGDSYEKGEDVELERVEPDPYPRGMVNEPWLTDKIPERDWVNTGDPTTWRDRSKVDGS